MKVLLTGAGGVLGTAFAAAMASEDLSCVGSRSLDVRDSVEIRRIIVSIRPEVVINCAAHTDLEAAEVDPDPVFAANTMLPSILGTACRRADALLVHFSSTGCYGNWLERPYTEEDPLRPTTVHHRSKSSGELAVIATGCEHLILRTGWLFGGGARRPKNFVWNRLMEAKGRATVKSDTHQRGNPTYAVDLVNQTLQLIQRGLRGTFNVVGQGEASRFDYVSEIVLRSGLPCEVEPGPAFQRRASVSPNEMAVNYRLKLLGLDFMPDWRTSLGVYVSMLTASAEWQAAQSRSP